MFEKIFEFDFSHISVSSHEKNIELERQLKASIKATCAALIKTSTYIEPSPWLWGDFCLTYYFLGVLKKKREREKKKKNISKEMRHT